MTDLSGRLSRLEQDVSGAVYASLARPDSPDVAAAKAEFLATFEEVKDKLPPMDEGEIRETDPLALQWLTAADYHRFAQALRRMAEMRDG
ncbi:MAG: hypothetical protein Q8P50_13055 [Bacillota bacterium]|nr:hypothetical protein [Bacillota bacterium]